MIKFGTGGFRGIIGDDFNKENVTLVAQGLSNIINMDNSKKPVIIGFEKRFMSDYYAKWFAEVLVANNIQVKYLPLPVPSPLVMQITKKLELDYGIMITASHNPYIFNGVKVFVKEGRDADVAFTNRLEKETLKAKVISLDFNKAKQNGLIEDFNYDEEYINGILEFVDINIIKKLDKKIIFNSMFGAGGKYAEMLTKKCGIENNVTIINTSKDAYFGERPPYPNEENLKSFSMQVAEKKFALGVGVDADSDRIGIIDENGKYYGCNTLLALIYYYCIKYRNQKGDIVKNNVTSLLVDKVANKLGFVAHEVNVGFKWVSAEMTRTNALIGGESSGGLTMRDYIWGKDALFSTAIMLEMIARINKPISEIIGELYEFADYNMEYFETAIKLNNKEKLQSQLEKIVPPFNKTIDKISRLDGVKYFFDDGTWASLRFSGTEPLLRVTLEMNNKMELEQVLKVQEQFVKDNN